MGVQIYKFDITAERVADQLQHSAVLSIVGFRRSGKSTLAEALCDGLGKFEYSVILQDASVWLQSKSGSFLKESKTQYSVDPEIFGTLERFEKILGNCCWIVDNAEVLLTYASEGVLRSIGKKLQNFEFSMILIRNRFVLEEKGWFQQRLSLIARDILQMNMRPVGEKDSIQIATSMFRSHSRNLQGKWLAKMSGGVLGLMSDLFRYTPEWPSEEITPRLEQLSIKKRQDLKLEKPVRQMILTALEKRILPPPNFLAKKAKTEVGVLIHVGMVTADYIVKERPYNGEFWELVSGQNLSPELIPNNFNNIGLNLEIMIREAGLFDKFGHDYGIDNWGEGVLAQAFANTLYCQEKYPALVDSLDIFLGENFGKFGLVRILQMNKVSAQANMSMSVLVSILFQRARSL